MLLWLEYCTYVPAFQCHALHENDKGDSASDSQMRMQNESITDPIILQNL